MHFCAKMLQILPRGKANHHCARLHSNFQDTVALLAARAAGILLFWCILCPCEGQFGAVRPLDLTPVPHFVAHTRAQFVGRLLTVC